MTSLKMPSKQTSLTKLAMPGDYLMTLGWFTIYYSAGLPGQPLQIWGDYIQNEDVHLALYGSDRCAEIIGLKCFTMGSFLNHLTLSEVWYCRQNARGLLVIKALEDKGLLPPQWFSQCDALISACLNSLSTAIKTQICWALISFVRVFLGKCTKAPWKEKIWFSCSN